MMIRNFFIYERLMVSDFKDQLVSYNCGPFRIELNPWSETITIRCASMWENLVDEFLNASSEAWCFVKENVKIDKGYFVIEITVKFDFEILKNYLGTEITYRPNTKLGNAPAEV